MSYLIILRPINAIITALCLLAGVWIVKPESSFSIYLIAVIAGFLYTSAGNVINDIFDISIDKSNNNTRPLASGKMQLSEARVYYYILVTLSQIVVIPIGFLAFFIALFTNILLYFYSRSFSSLPLVGNLVVAFLAGLAFISPGLILGNIDKIMYPALFAFFSTLIRELIKDIEDIKGDEKSGRKTYPIVFGVKNTRVVITVVYVLLFIVTLLPFLHQYYKIEYFILVMVIVNPLILYSIVLLHKTEYKKYLSRASFLMKVAMVSGLTAIVVGI